MRIVSSLPTFFFIMKNIRIQITLDVEYNVINEESRSVWKHLLAGLENNIHLAIGDGLLDQPDIHEITGWDLNLKIVDPEKEKAQFHATRSSQLAEVKALFSSDGPAVIVSQFGQSLPPEDRPLDEFINEINGALREAHQKYLANLREG